MSCRKYDRTLIPILFVFFFRQNQKSCPVDLVIFDGFFYNIQIVEPQGQSLWLYSIHPLFSLYKCSNTGSNIADDHMGKIPDFLPTKKQRG